MSPSIIPANKETAGNLQFLLNDVTRLGCRAILPARIILDKEAIGSTQLLWNWFWVNDYNHWWLMLRTRKLHNSVSPQSHKLSLHLITLYWGWTIPWWRHLSKVYWETIARSWPRVDDEEDGAWRRNHDSVILWSVALMSRSSRLMTRWWQLASSRTICIYIVCNIYQ